MALKTCPRATLTEQKPLMLVSAFPTMTSIDSRRAWSSTAECQLISYLNRDGKVSRKQLATDYLFESRPPKGELLAFFRPQSKKKTAQTPELDAVEWVNICLNGEDVEGIFPWAWAELQNFKANLHRVRPKIIVTHDKYSTWLLTGLGTQAMLEASINGFQEKLRASQIPISPYWGLPADTIVMPIMPTALISYDKTRLSFHRQDCIRVGSYVAAASHSEEAWQERTTIVEKFTISEDFTTTYDALKNLLAMEVTDVACDIETSCNSIDCLSFAWSDTEGLAVSFYPKGKVDKPLFSYQEEADLKWLIREILHKHRIVGQNFFYDREYLFWEVGAFCNAHDDTMGQAFVMYQDREKDLGTLSSLWREKHAYWKDGIKDDTVYGRALYCVRDSIATLEISYVQNALLQRRAKGLQEFYAFTQREVGETFLRMNLRGMPTNIQAMKDTHTQLKSLIKEHTDWLNDALPETVNYQSPKQLAQVFYGNFGEPLQTLKGVSPASTNDIALNVIQQNGGLASVVAARIQEIRSLTKAAQDCEIIIDPDNCTRTIYNPYGTRTYRANSKKTNRILGWGGRIPKGGGGIGRNLQNVTKGGDKSKFGLVLPNQRSMFIPPPDHPVFDVDLDSADARIVAARSGAKNLQKWFDEGKKPYVEVMKRYYNNDSMTKHDPEYILFKKIIHGTHYFGKAQGLAISTGLDLEIVRQIQDWYLYELCPEILDWHKDICRRVDRGEPIITVFGAELSINRDDATAYEKAAASEPQSTVATLINKGMVAIDRHESDISVRLNVHDSIAGFFHKDDVTAPQRIIDRCTIPLDYGHTTITIPVEIKCSPVSWGDCG